MKKGLFEVFRLESGSMSSRKQSFCSPFSQGGQRGSPGCVGKFESEKRRLELRER
jgi:hypothetical protein